MKLFVWDFHGVLEKGNEYAVLEISNEALKQNGYSERFSDSDVNKYYGLKWYEYFEKILPNETNDIHRKLQDDSIAIADRSDIVKKFIKPNDHAIDVVKHIKSNGHEQILLSNTMDDHLRWFIESVNMTGLFDDEKIIGVDAHRNLSNKKLALENYLADNNFDEIIIIGDSMGDIELKDVAGGKVYYYRHPYLDFAENDKADYRINDLREVLREV